MATVCAVNSKASQSHGSLHGVLKYVSQDRKTVWEREKLVSGINCLAPNAYSEFIGTKVQFRKDNGVMYYHFVQSFPPGEKITPKQAHEYALEFAQHWKGFEVVAATHRDRDHIHTHFIINSVSFENGKKYHVDRDEIKALQRLNDELCLKYGLSICDRKPKAERVDSMKQSEYHSATRGESWKMELRIAIDDAMKYASSRDHFIELLRSEGYSVRWEKDRKSITFTHPNGMKCRDYRLGEIKYLKGAMENEFRIRNKIIFGGAENESESQFGSGQDGNFTDRADRSQLGSARRQYAAADGGNGAEHVETSGTDDREPNGRTSVNTGESYSERSNGNSGEDQGSVGKNTDGPTEPERLAENADGEINLRNIITGWESEREFFLSVLRNEGQHEKVAEKDYVDRAHTFGTGLRPGTAALNLIGGLARMTEGEPQRYGESDDEDDIDKELRRQERAVKDGINLVM